MKQTAAGLHTELINTVRELYEKGDKIGVIDKSMTAVEIGLLAGWNTGMMATKLLDLGVRPEELGTAISMAIMRIPDSALNDKDRLVKIEAKRIWKDALEEHNNGRT